jgi:hypothetical protein
MQKDYPKYIASDNEIVGGNESNMNYLMTIKKEEDGRTINEDDIGYYKKVLYIQKHYHYYYFSSAIRPDFNYKYQKYLNVRCDATIKKNLELHCDGSIYKIDITCTYMHFLI